MSEQIYMMVYTSRATSPVTTELMNDIRTFADRNNSRDGITGLLLCYEQAFLQVLEGPEHKVRACFERIRADRRHTGILVCAQSMADERTLPAWTMGYVEGRTAPVPAGNLFSLLELVGSSAYPLEAESLRSILKTFVKNSRMVDLVDPPHAFVSVNS